MFPDSNRHQLTIWDAAIALTLPGVAQLLEVAFLRRFEWLELGESRFDPSDSLDAELLSLTGKVCIAATPATR